MDLHGRTDLAYGVFQALCTYYQYKISLCSYGNSKRLSVFPFVNFLLSLCYTASKDSLSIAYSPGVAEPCLAIRDNEDLSYEYTSRGHLVGVISNGTAVLGLGNIGASASKPVMVRRGG